MTDVSNAQPTDQPDAAAGDGVPETAASQTQGPDAPVSGEELARAQRERDPESVGAPAGHFARRLVTADEGDAHRDWTVQSGRPFPQDETAGPTTRFHPAELPNPDKAVEAGFIPQVMPPSLVDSEYRTQPPSENVRWDDGLRDAFQTEPEDGEDDEHEPGLRLHPNILSSYAAAQEQKADDPRYTTRSITE